jgi:hypothetical protein
VDQVPAKDAREQASTQRADQPGDTPTGDD